MLRYIAKFQTKMAQLNDERGATAVEYGLMVALIAAVIVGVVLLLGQQLSTLFEGITTDITV